MVAPSRQARDVAPIDDAVTSRNLVGTVEFHFSTALGYVRFNAPRRLTDLAQAERFQLLIEAVKDYAIYLLDAEGRVATWNTGAQLFKGYTAEEIIGRHFSIFYTEEDRAAGLPERALADRRPRRVGSRPRAGGCARTARASGPTW